MTGTQLHQRLEETIRQANDRLMLELTNEVKAFVQLADEQAQLVQSLGGRRNHQRIKGKQ